MFFLGEQEGLGKPLLIIYIDIDKKSEVQYRVKLDNEGEEKKKGRTQNKLSKLFQSLSDKGEVVAFRTMDNQGEFMLEDCFYCRKLRLILVENEAIPNCPNAPTPKNNYFHKEGYT